jgi:RNA polymerase sigma-70 factor (ECF subfamily)
MMTVATVDTPSASIEDLYRQDGDRLWRALLAYSRDPELASDAVAEAYAQLIRRGASVSNPQAWVWRAGFRIAAGELKARRASTDLDSAGTGGMAGTTPVAPVDPGVDHDLLDALAQLPPKQRAAVVLFYYADASVRDIAARTGMSQLSVRVNLSRGRQRLKQILGGDDA